MDAVATRVQGSIRDLFDRYGPSEPESPLNQAGLRDGIRVVREYLKHGERGLALEHLLYMISEPGVPVDQNDWTTLAQIGEAMGLADHVERTRAIPCPACGFLTLHDSYGSYAICDVCGWEDDQVQLANPACGGGANASSLIEAQAQALAELPLSTGTLGEVRRDPRWRPLSESERRRAEGERDEVYWKRTGVVWLYESYWMLGRDSQSAG